jgi:hypothetical protein
MANCQRIISTFVLVAMLTACNVEVVHPVGVVVYVPEVTFRKVTVGMSPDQVVKTIGTAVRTEKTPSGELWIYGVLRGPEPGMLQFLFGDRPKEEQFSSGEIEFVSGRVAKLEITATVARTTLGHQH